MVDHTVAGYTPLPDWPDVQPDASVREPKQDAPSPAETQTNFYKDEKSSSEESSSEDSSSDDSSDSSDDSSSGDSSGESSEDSSEDSSDDSSDDSESSEEEAVKPAPMAQALHTGHSASYGMTNQDLLGGGDVSIFESNGMAGTDLLGVGFSVPSPSASPPMMDLMSPSPTMGMGMGMQQQKPMGMGGGGGGGAMGGLLNDMAGLTMSAPVSVTQPMNNASSAPSLSSRHTLLRREMAGGLQLTYQFVRGGNNSNMKANTLAVVLTFENTRSEMLKKIRLFSSKISPALELAQLQPGEKSAQNATLDISAGDTLSFQLNTNMGSFSGNLVVPQAELLAPLRLSEMDFNSAKQSLGGFNEATTKLNLARFF
jgi:hypothetical protein